MGWRLVGWDGVGGWLAGWGGVGWRTVSANHYFTVRYNIPPHFLPVSYLSIFPIRVKYAKPVCSTVILSINTYIIMQRPHDLGKKGTPWHFLFFLLLTLALIPNVFSPRACIFVMTKNRCTVSSRRGTRLAKRALRFRGSTRAAMGSLDRTCTPSSSASTPRSPCYTGMIFDVYRIEFARDIRQ